MKTSKSKWVNDRPDAICLSWPHLKAVMDTHPCWCRHCCQHSCTSQKLWTYDSTLGKKAHFASAALHPSLIMSQPLSEQKILFTLLSPLISVLLRESNLDSSLSSESQTNCYPHSHWRNRHHDKSDGGRQDFFTCDKVQAGNEASFPSSLQSLQTQSPTSYFQTEHIWYDIKSIKVLRQLSCNSKDTIFTVTFQKTVLLFSFYPLNI